MTTEELTCQCHSDKTSDEAETVENVNGFIFRFCIALVLLALAKILKLSGMTELICLLSAYLIVSYQLLLKAGRNIIKGEIFDENSLVALASLGAFGIGESTEAISVVIFYCLGELLQDLAVQRSRERITALLDIKPEIANLKTRNGIVTVAVESIRVNNVIVVKPGEKVPLDGRILSGYSSVDAVALSGESLPQAVKPKDQVLAGMINLDGVLEVRVEHDYENSTVAKILNLVENSKKQKGANERFITRFAKVYTPAVVMIAVAVIVIPPVLHIGSFTDWLYRGLSFLIIACPCALVISIPLSYFGGIGAAAHHGILIKGSNSLEKLRNLHTVVFDKTGTLTKGKFKIIEVLPTNGVTKNELLGWAALAEQHSNHPIATSIVKAYGKELEQEVEITEIAGKGIVATTASNTSIYVGNKALLADLGLNNLPQYANTAIYVAVAGKYYGCLLIGDEMRNDLKEALTSMKAQGVQRLIMLSGDNERIVKAVADDLGIEEYRAGLLPVDKVRLLEQLPTTGVVTAFVGDGINDAPALQVAEIGIALGGIGSDAAIEAADIVIMNDDLGKITTALKIAKKTNRIVWQNIVMALSVKTGIMLLAFLGITSIWLAIFADMGVALLALLNALRVMIV